MPSRPHFALIGSSISGPNEKALGGASNASVKPKNDIEQERIYVASSEHLLQVVQHKLESLFRSSSGGDDVAFCQQAFKFVRGEDSTVQYITCRMFLDRIPQLGFCVSRRTGVQAFNRIDHRKRGRMEFEVFADWLVPGIQLQTTQIRNILAMAKSLTTKGATEQIPKLQADATPDSVPDGSSDIRFQPLETAEPSTNSSLEFHETKSTERREPAHLSYETMSTTEIEHHIAQNLLARTSRDTDRFRQAFRFFTKSENITSQDFHTALHKLHIPLSFKKAKEVFDQFDLDGNGCIELYEFTLILFKKETEELPLFGNASSALNAATGSAKAQLPVLVATTHVGQTPGCSGQDTPASATADEAHDGHAIIGNATTEDLIAMLLERVKQKTMRNTERLRHTLLRIFGKVSAIGVHDMNIAFLKLGLRLSASQIKEVFERLDIDQSGELDLNKIVQGFSRDENPLNDSMARHNHRDKEEEEREKRQGLYEKALQSMQNKYTLEELEQMLREKIEQRTSRSSDCFRQAFRIFKKVNGIRPDEFHRAIMACGIIIDQQLSDKLFSRYDANQSGDLDLNEFIQGILPKDYTGKQWIEAADASHFLTTEQKRLNAKTTRDQYATQHEMENWSLDEIEKRIRDKIEQSTSKSSDSFRQAYKIFHKSNHVTVEDFRQRLLAFGFRLTNEQCDGLFKRYDTNGSNDLDLQEFCMRVLPPDYTNDSDKWFQSDLEQKSRNKEKLDFVKQTRNGLINMATPTSTTTLCVSDQRPEGPTRNVPDAMDETASLFKKLDGALEQNPNPRPHSDTDTKKGRINDNVIELVSPVAPRPRTTGCSGVSSKSGGIVVSPRAGSRVVMVKTQCNDSKSNSSAESMPREECKNQQVDEWEQLTQDAVRNSVGVRACTPRLSVPTSFESLSQSEDTVSIRSTSSVGSVGRAKYKPQINSSLMLQRMVQGAAASAAKADELSMSSPVGVAPSRVQSVPKSAGMARFPRSKQV